MPRTIDEGFRDFLSSLTPSDGESAAARQHRASIQACLQNNFTLKRLFRTGSVGNGTSIYAYSDVDYFASVPSNDLKQNSAATLREFREILENRFPQTGAHVSSPAVRLPFGNGANEVHEITPADFVKESYGNKIYEIADGQGGWMRSSPDAHNAYVHSVNERHAYKVKPLIRFLKAWKYYRQVPISSFYLELRVAKYAAGENSIVYDIDVKRILADLADIRLAGMQDPAEISGYIHPCASDAQLDDALSKLDTARARAEKACEAETKGDTKTAFSCWQLLYNDHFPSYYR